MGCDKKGADLFLEFSLIDKIITTHLDNNRFIDSIRLIVKSENILNHIVEEHHDEYTEEVLVKLIDKKDKLKEVNDTLFTYMLENKISTK